MDFTLLNSILYLTGVLVNIIVGLVNLLTDLSLFGIEIISLKLHFLGSLFHERNLCFLLLDALLKVLVLSLKKVH